MVCVLPTGVASSLQAFVRKLAIASAIVGVAGLSGCAGSTAPTQPAEKLPAVQKLAGPRPQLVVVVVVDQMRADYLDRFAELFANEPGGFLWLEQQGVNFAQASVAQAPTKTAPGHASIVTGTYAATHGVVLNHWYDVEQNTEQHAGDDPQATVVGGPPAVKARAYSSHQLLRPSVGDWLKRQSPQSMVYAVAAKDRAAVMLGGLRPDGVWWYDKHRAAYVTSSFYTPKLHAWVDVFNQSGQIDQYFTTGWKRFANKDVYTKMGPDAVAQEVFGFSSVFPYTFDTGNPSDLAAYHKRLPVTPFSDSLSFELAKRTITAAGLGLDQHPDLLLIGASAGDKIGHAFGPDSHEILDHYLRLDRELIQLYQHLVSTRGDQTFAILLTSDHGVQAFPEHLREGGETEARRVLTEDFERDVRRVFNDVVDQLGVSRAVLRHIGTHGLWFDHRHTEAAGLHPDAVEDAVASALRQLDYVADALTAQELRGHRPVAEARPWLTLYRRGFHDGRSPDIVFRIEPGTLAPTLFTGTTHGSPYGYDTHIPLLVGGAGLGHHTVTSPVDLVDVAPTVADLLGIRAAPGIDGESLLPLIIYGEPQTAVSDTQGS